VAPPRRRRSGSVFLFGTLIVLALLWLVYWYGASEIASAVRDRVTAAAAARGYAVDCANAAEGGFPLSIDVSCSRASLAGQSTRITAVIDGVSTTAPLYRPGRVEWIATGPLVVDAPAGGIGLTATWRRAEASLNGGINGLSAGTTLLEDVRIALPPDRRMLPYAGLALSSAYLLIAPAADEDYSISAAAKAVALESDDGRTLPEIDVEAELAALAVGNSLGLDPRRILRDWLARGGTLRIDKLSLAAGDVSTTQSGTLTLSPDGKLSGNLKLVIAGIEKLPDLVEEFRPGSRQRVAEAASALVVFSKPVETPNGQAREMALIIRDSVVSIGIIPIGVIPTLAF
jgi:hypothetical protein